MINLKGTPLLIKLVWAKSIHGLSEFDGSDFFSSHDQGCDFIASGICENGQKMLRNSTYLAHKIC